MIHQLIIVFFNKLIRVHDRRKIVRADFCVFYLFLCFLSILTHSEVDNYRKIY